MFTSPNGTVSIRRWHARWSIPLSSPRAASSLHLDGRGALEPAFRSGPVLPFREERMWTSTRAPSSLLLPAWRFTTPATAWSRGSTAPTVSAAAASTSGSRSIYRSIAERAVGPCATVRPGALVGSAWRVVQWVRDDGPVGGDHAGASLAGEHGGTCRLVQCATRAASLLDIEEREQEPGSVRSPRR